MTTSAAGVDGLAHVAEQIVSPEEYNLLTRALAAAEQPYAAAVSCYLSLNPAGARNRRIHVDVPVVLTLTPRPRFPPPVLAELVPLALCHVLRCRHPHAPYAPLYFHPGSAPRVRTVCARYGLAACLPEELLGAALALAQRSEGAPSVDDVARVLGPSLWPTLLPFQRDGVERAVRAMHGRVLFADDMGLGKTLQALAVADYFQRTKKASGPTLVLCPAMLRLSWARAIVRWLPSASQLSVHVISSPAAVRRLLTPVAAARDPWDAPPAVSHVVCGYDLLPRLCAPDSDGEFVAPGVFPIVIADECHLLRNAATARTRAALPLLIGAAVRILISGTPALSRPGDIYPLLCALLHEDRAPFLPFHVFADRYGVNVGGVPIRHPASRAHELHALLSAVMIRRYKRDVHVSLPPKKRMRIVTQLSPDRLQHLIELAAQAEHLKECLDSPHDPGATFALRAQREALFSVMYTETSNVKLGAVLTRVHQLLCGTRQQGNERKRRKLLVFAHHAKVLDAVDAFAAVRGVRRVRIDGGTGCAERERAVDAFQTDRSIEVALLSFNVAATGVTLTAADTVLFAELCWVPATLAQAEDRAHRIGRVGPVTVEYVVAPGTLDDAMMSSIQAKAGLVNKTVDGDYNYNHNNSIYSNCNNGPPEDVLSACHGCIELSEVDIQAVVSDSLLRAGQTCMRDDMPMAGDSQNGPLGDSVDGEHAT